MPRGEKLGDRLFRVGLEVLHAHSPPLVMEVMGTVCTKRNFMSRNICLFENVFFVVRTQKVRRLVSAGSLVKKG